MNVPGPIELIRVPALTSRAPYAYVAVASEALDAAGARLVDVVKTTVYVASQRREDLVLAWNVVSRHFGDHDVPSTLLGVAVLGYPDQLVEVEAIAALR